MNNEQALALMSSATDVKDWNSKRLQVRHKVTLAQWQGTNKDGLHAAIDASGLIVKVLGADPRYNKINR